MVWLVIVPPVLADSSERRCQTRFILYAVQSVKFHSRSNRIRNVSVARTPKAQAKRTGPKTTCDGDRMDCPSNTLRRLERILDLSCEFWIVIQKNRSPLCRRNVNGGDAQNTLVDGRGLKNYLKQITPRCCQNPVFVATIPRANPGRLVWC